MKPEALNRIEERAVFGQPDHLNSVSPNTQGSLDGVAAMVGGVVHDQDQRLMGIFGEQMFNKGDETVTVLVGSGGVTHSPATPVVAAENVQRERTPRCRDASTLAFTHPTAPQGWMQAHGCFVHKDELGFSNGVERDVFFSQSSTSSATVCTELSCR